MKYQFTTEGSKPQTKYHRIHICERGTDAVLFEAIVSSPAKSLELLLTLQHYLDENPHCENMYVSHKAVYDSATHCTPDIISVGTMCRIISNIKPLKQKVVISICGERKTYELDADKLETLLKSLE